MLPANPRRYLRSFLTYIGSDAVRLDVERLVAIQDGFRHSIRHAEEAGAAQIGLKQLWVDGQRVVEVGDAFETRKPITFTTIKTI